MRAEIKGIESRKIIEKNQQNQNRFFARSITLTDF